MSAVAVAGARTNGTTETCNPNTRRLYWFKARLSGQLFDCVLTSAATVTCIAKRCVTSNPVLRSLPQFAYPGMVVGALQKPLDAKHFIRVNTTSTTGLSIKINNPVTLGDLYCDYCDYCDRTITANSCLATKLTSTIDHTFQ